jgi:hypothetical protein
LKVQLNSITALDAKRPRAPTAARLQDGELIADESRVGVTIDQRVSASR